MAKNTISKRHTPSYTLHRAMWFLGFFVFLLFLIVPFTLLFQSPTLVFFVAASLILAKWWSLRKQENKSYQKASFHCRPGSNLFVTKTYPSSTTTSLSSPSSPHKHTVFFHGMLGSSRFWDTTVTHLSQQEKAKRHSTDASIHSIVTPDLLGFGRSPWPCGPQHYSMDEHCAWLIRDTLPPPPSSSSPPSPPQEIHLIGHSMGSLMALEVAARLPPHLKLGSVTVISMPFFQTFEEAHSTLRRSLIPYFFIRFPTPTYLLCSILCQQRWLWSPPLSYFLSFVTAPFPRLHIPQPIIEDFFLHSCESASQTMHQCILSHSISPTAETLKKNGTPIHVIHGLEDPTTCPQKAKTFASLYGSSYHGVKRGGHLLPLHAPKVVSEVVKEGVEGVIEEGVWKEYECK